MPEFHGVLPALITPFTADGAALDTRQLEPHPYRVRVRVRS